MSGLLCLNLATGRRNVAQSSGQLIPRDAPRPASLGHHPWDVMGITEVDDAAA